MNRTEVDGVPAVWLDVPGPLRAGLVFRAGMVDETLARFGATHLVEHLALQPLSRLGPSGTVDLLATTFSLAAPADELPDALAALCSSIAAPPAERLEIEKRVLATEAGPGTAAVEAALLNARYGARGPGLAMMRELGLRSVDADAIRALVASSFTRGNAALWLTGPPPAGLRLPLPDGPRRPATEPVPLPSLRLPGAASGVAGAVGTAAVSHDVDGAASVLAAVVSRRALRALREGRGVSYDVDGGAKRISARARQVSVVADALDEHAAIVRDELVAAWRAVASGAPLAGDRETFLRWMREVLAETHGLRAALEANALRLLLDEDLRSIEGAIELIVGVADDDVAALASALVDDLIVVAPDAVPLGGFGELRPPAEPVDGRRHPLRRIPKHVIFSDAALVVGERGVSLSGSAGAATVLYDDLAAAIDEPGRGLHLVGVDGTELAVDPADYRDGERAVEAIRARVPTALSVGLDDRAARVEALASKQRVGRFTTGETLDLVWPRLAYDEEVRVLAEASTGVRPGVLAVTDRRLLLVTKVLNEDVQEWPRSSIVSVSGRDVALMARLKLSLRDGDTVQLWVGPRGRLAVILQELRGGR